MLNQIIRNFETQNSAKVVYITIYGSKLFGTDNKNSDTDYKGIFIPSKRDVLLKKDILHFNYNTNSKTKNDKDDIDIQFYSIYKWFSLLQKGETGALDLLFSMFREDTQAFNDTNFTSIIKANYQKFYNKNLHSFVGYCVGQSKLYNIKGERYNELDIFVKYFQNVDKSKYSLKLSTVFDEIQEILDNQKFKYIRFTKGALSRGNQGYKEGIYIELLGKRFSQMVSVEYFLTHIQDMQKQFGNRTISSAKGVDYKALSHAVRVINEVEELLDTNFITFPLLNKEYIISIKEGKKNLEEVMNYIDIKLDIVQNKLENSNLAEKSDEEFISNLIIELL